MSKTLKCRGCTKDSRVKDLGGSVSEISEGTAFKWIPIADGESIWVCTACARSSLELVKRVTDLVRDLYTYPPTLRGLLKR